jgi:hypothetical protein
MDDELARLVQAGAAIASVLVALGAVVVAMQAKGVAEKSVATARRQVALGAIPYLSIQDVLPRGDDTLGVKIANIGHLAAIHVTVTLLIDGSEPRLGHWSDMLPPNGVAEVRIPIEGLRTKRDPTLPPIRSAGEWEADKPRWYHERAVLLVRYIGPQGANVRSFFRWHIEGNVRNLIRLSIDPGDGGEQILIDLPDQYRWWSPPAGSDTIPD